MPFNKKSKPSFNSSLPFIIDNYKGNAINNKQQYVNLDGPSERSFSELFQWQLERNPLRLLKKNQQTNVSVISTNNFISDKADGFTWMGHASFLMTLNGLNIITDPVLGNVGPVKRYTPLPCAVEALTDIDIILLSHNHRDHADKKSMEQLCMLNPQAVIYTGLEISKLLRSWNIHNNIIEAGWYQQFPPVGDIKVTYLPAKHWNRRGVTDLNEMLWGSFMLQTDKHCLYFGADSGAGVHYKQIAELFPAINYAFLGIGAYKPEWFMHTAHTSPADAITCLKQLKGQTMIPMHHGCFDLSDEPIFYPKQELMHLQKQHNIQNILHLTIGEKFHLS